MLLAPDGRVVFLDFGLMRHVDAAYLEGERGLARAVMARDAAAIKAAMASLGYLPEPDEFTGEGLLAQLLAAAGWYFRTGFRRLDPEYVRVTIERVRARDRSSSARCAGRPCRRRRCSSAAWRACSSRVFGELRAGARWHGLAREYISGEPTSTPLGREEDAWLAGAPVAS